MTAQAEEVSMKYDEGSLIGSQFRKRENVTYGKPARERKLPGLLDIFIVQAAVPPRRRHS